MKKIIALLLVAIVTLSLGACGAKSVPPIEKLNNFIMENGVQNGEEYVLDCPEIAETFKDYDFTIAAMENLKDSNKAEFKLIKAADGIRIEVIDSSLTDNGLKIDRQVVLNPDGTFYFVNGMAMNGEFLGVKLKGEIPVETYTKEITPVITESELSEGSSITDAVKSVLSDYINLALDGYSNAISKEGLELTLADVGYASYK